MRIRITDAAVSIRHIPYNEMGIREYTRFISKDQMWDHMWVYDVIDEKRFFLAVLKYGISYDIHQTNCSV